MTEKLLRKFVRSYNSFSIGTESAKLVMEIFNKVASISLKLDKPLSGHLIPIKGKKAGDDAVLESRFLVPTKVFRVK